MALSLSILICFIFLADKKLRKIFLVCVICAIPLFIYLTDAAFIERTKTLFISGKSLNNQEQTDQISSGRTEIWRYGVKMVRDYPFGAGPNGFKNLAHLYLPAEILNYRLGDNGVRSAHNTYLEVLIEQGFLGLFIFLIIICNTIYLLIKGVRKLNRGKMLNSFLHYQVVALGISFISILFGGLFNSRVYYEFFWWQIALCIVIYSFIKEIDEEVANV